MTLAKEIEQQQQELDQIKKLMELYPDLRKNVNRWKTVTYCSKTANSQCNDFGMRYSCGCCSDAAKMVLPFIETPYGKVHSDPVEFTIGSKDSSELLDFEKHMTDSGIPKELIERIRKTYEKTEEEEENNDISAHVEFLNNPKGWIIKKTIDETNYYLNQAVGDWASFATVYLSENIANKALASYLLGEFKNFKTDERSDH